MYSRAKMYMYIMDNGSQLNFAYIHRHIESKYK